MIRINFIALVFGACNASGQLIDSFTKALMAGSASGLPTDSPSLRIDFNGLNSSFASVGSLNIQSGGLPYLGSGWLFLQNDDQIDSNLSVTFNWKIGFSR